MVGPTTFGYQNLGFGAGVSGDQDYVLIKTRTPSGTAAIDFTSIDERTVEIFNSLARLSITLVSEFLFITHFI